MQVWKDILGYEGLYKISNKGLVKSSERYVNNSKSKRIVREKILKLETVSGGYKRVSLCKNCEIKRFAVHRLVASHFVENIGNKPIVNHKDRNPSNNVFSNLEWVTTRENVSHASTSNTGFTGIHKLKGLNTFQVRIFYNGESIYIGSTTSLEKAKKMYKDYIRLNGIKNKYINK